MKDERSVEELIGALKRQTAANKEKEPPPMHRPLSESMSARFVFGTLGVCYVPSFFFICLITGWQVVDAFWLRVVQAFWLAVGLAIAHVLGREFEQMAHEARHKELERQLAQVKRDHE